jgi:hypothetical protein
MNSSGSISVSTCSAEFICILRQKFLVRLTLVSIILTVLLVVTGCRNPIDTTALNSLAKSDVYMMADTSLQEMNRLMEDLLNNLYKRNPRELDKRPGMTIGQRHDQIFDSQGRLMFSELHSKQGTDALNLAFSPDYRGDRVFALMVGLVGMVRSAYNWQTEQFMFDSLDEQKLFNCARNIEVLALRLSNERNADGKLLLLSNSQPGEKENLGFERLFGKMIAIQDMMAFTVAGKWDRGVHSMIMKAVFLPMGM